MTNKKAIKILKNMILEDKRVYGDKPKQRNGALELAIKALEDVDRLEEENHENFVNSQHTISMLMEEIKR